LDFYLIFRFFRGIAKRLPLSDLMSNPLANVCRGYPELSANYSRELSTPSGKGSEGIGNLGTLWQIFVIA
jgi:hypothetical protein